MKRFVLALLVLLLTACTSAPPTTLTVTGIWARPGISGGNSAIYLTIANETGADDTLLEARTEAASSVELHQTTRRDDGAMSMVQQASVPIPTGARVEFMPGGLHIMLIGLQSDLEIGQTFDVELHFEKAGTLRYQVEVQDGGGH
jgi:periplasmic copper chaperone A